MNMVPRRSDGGDCAAHEGASPSRAPSSLASPDGACPPEGIADVGAAALAAPGLELAPRRWNRPLRVLLALAGPAACETARVYLELAEGFSVVGTAPNGHRALALAAEIEPDVVVVDAHLPAGGLAVIPAVRRRSPSSLVVALAGPADLAAVDVASDAAADPGPGRRSGSPRTTTGRTSSP